MEKWEYEKLVGYDVTDEKFREINELYKACGDMDMETFAYEQKNLGDSKILEALGVRVAQLQAQLDALMAKATYNAFCIAGMTGPSREVRQVAVNLVGAREYTRQRLKNNNVLLTRDDRDYLLAVLSEPAAPGVSSKD